MRKPVVYIASPYTKGDPAINVRQSCRVFDQLLTDGKVTPVAPLWSHLQHLLFPRAYADWLEYCREIIALCDACLRVTAEYPALGYRQEESAGADQEVVWFREQEKPVFLGIQYLYNWIDSGEWEG